MQASASALYQFPVGPLPSGRHSLTRDVVLASQRGRLMEAMAEAVAEHGYGSMTIAHVVSGAGVSRKTFYEHFADKQDCFLAMYDTGIVYLVGRVADALEGQDDPHARLAVGLRAFLSVLAEEPTFCRAIVLEVHAAGPEALARRRAVLQVFADRYLEVNELARAEDKRIAPLSQEVALGLVGAILELVSTRVEADRTTEIEELAEPLTAFVVHNVLAKG
ncbi:MAG TPA: TetR/AcrR family transcriptional regulator [Thermoleophilaceae bacterium]|nr:TetR/AcrR family transcriptional regulator [Thermoleophilaceae bacterium]